MFDEIINKVKNHKKVIIFSCLAGVIFLLVITNIIWLSIDTLPPYRDNCRHMFHSKLLSEGFGNIVKIPQWYPPFFYLTTVPIIKIIGACDDHFVYGNFLYIIILVLSVFGIGKILFDEWVGVGSAFLVLLYPFVFFMSRQYYLDFALMAMVSLVQYLILKSEGGIKKYWSIGLGVSIGCTLLTKTHGMVFFLPTWVFIFLICHKKIIDWAFFLRVLLIGLIIALPWYIFASGNFLNWNIHLYKTQESLLQNKSLFTGVLYYKDQLYNHMVCPYLFLVSLVGLVFSLVFDKRRKSLIFLLLWIIVPYFILALWFNKNPRFIMPILPAIAIITLGGISKVPHKLFRGVCYISIFLIALLQFVHFSFRPILIFKKSANIFNSLSTKPSRVDWKIKEALDFLSSYTESRKSSVCFVTRHPYFNSRLVTYYGSYNGLSFEVKDNSDLGRVQAPGKSKLKINELKKCDFVVVTKQNGECDPSEELCKEFYKIADKLGTIKIQEFYLPENYKAVIYENPKREN